MISLRMKDGIPGLRHIEDGEETWPVGHVADAPHIRVLMVEGERRRAIRSDGFDVPPGEVLEALAAAGTELFGEHWEQSLARVAGIQARSIRKWVRNRTLPPARIVQWVGWARCKDRDFGRLCEAMALLPVWPGMTNTEILESVFKGTFAVGLVREGGGSR